MKRKMSCGEGSPRSRGGFRASRGGENRWRRRKKCSPRRKKCSPGALLCSPGAFFPSHSASQHFARRKISFEGGENASRRAPGASRRAILSCRRRKISFAVAKIRCLGASRCSAGREGIVPGQRLRHQAVSVLWLFMRPSPFARRPSVRRAARGSRTLRGRSAGTRRDLSERRRD